MPTVNFEYEHQRVLQPGMTETVSILKTVSKWTPEWSPSESDDFFVTFSLLRVCVHVLFFFAVKDRESTVDARDPNILRSEWWTFPRFCFQRFAFSPPRIHHDVSTRRHHLWKFQVLQMGQCKIMNEHELLTGQNCL